MKVKVDTEKCIGCGGCESVCPKIFEIKDGKAQVKKSDTNEKCVNEAEEICPVGAIKVE